LAQNEEPGFRSSNAGSRRRLGQRQLALMKTRTHFAHSIDMLDAAGEIQEHLAGVEDYMLAEVVWREAIARWPKATIILRQGARVVHMTAADPGS
jgi:hypothetical protein